MDSEKKTKPQAQRQGIAKADAAPEDRDREITAIAEALKRLRVPKKEVARFVRELTGPQPSSGEDQSRGTGQAAAAQKNRERETQLNIIRKLEDLGVPEKDWPSFVRRPAWPEYSHSYTPPVFQPPAFEQLRESVNDWRKRLDAEWKRFRDDQMQLVTSWVTVGVDEEIAEAKRTRGTGKGEKRVNVEIAARYLWAARRLKGESWKNIAVDAGDLEYRVRKTATDVLKIAGWDK